MEFLSHPITQTLAVILITCAAGLLGKILISRSDDAHRVDRRLRDVTARRER